MDVNKGDGFHFEEWFSLDDENWFLLNDMRGNYYYPYGSEMKIKYLHQLQNLYHSLTGKELQKK